MPWKHANSRWLKNGSIQEAAFKHLRTGGKTQQDSNPLRSVRKHVRTPACPLETCPFMKSSPESRTKPLFSSHSGLLSCDPGRSCRYIPTFWRTCCLHLQSSYETLHVKDVQYAKYITPEAFTIVTGEIVALWIVTPCSLGMWPPLRRNMPPPSSGWNVELIDSTTNDYSFPRTPPL